MIRSILKALVTPHDKFAPAFVCKRRQTIAQMEYRVWKSMQWKSGRCQYVSRFDDTCMNLRCWIDCWMSEWWINHWLKRQTTTEEPNMTLCWSYTLNTMSKRRETVEWDARIQMPRCASLIEVYLMNGCLWFCKRKPWNICIINSHWNVYICTKHI